MTLRSLSLNGTMDLFAYVCAMYGIRASGLPQEIVYIAGIGIFAIIFGKYLIYAVKQARETKEEQKSFVIRYGYKDFNGDFVFFERYVSKKVFDEHRLIALNSTYKVQISEGNAVLTPDNAAQVLVQTFAITFIVADGSKIELNQN